MGVYYPVIAKGREEGSKAKRVNERHVYERGTGLERHPIHGKLEMWWAQQCWWLGPSTSCGEPAGLLRCQSTVRFLASACTTHRLVKRIKSLTTLSLCASKQ